MPDIETLLRAALAERAERALPRTEAVDAAVAAVQHRRRGQVTASSVAAAAAVGAIALAISAWPHASRGADPDSAVAASTATSGTPSPTPLRSGGVNPTATTPPTATAPQSSQAVPTTLGTVFGGDYTAQPQSPSGFGGDLTLTPGSRSAAGLPAGYAAAISLVVLDQVSASYPGTVDTMKTLCAPLVEKGAIFKACVPETHATLTVQRSEIDAPNTKVGTFATLRILYTRPDGKVQYAEATVWKTAQPSTAQERTQAAAWLKAQNNKLAEAATTAK